MTPASMAVTASVIPAIDVIAAVSPSGSFATSVKNITKNVVSTVLIKENPTSLIPQKFLICLLIFFIYSPLNNYF
ncbi:hypothetical protein SDC9_115921 [bioreactor metagenome]|uniref:Uncharacterized protein n=1 Tax=bioreactor metagenome TaxID=1076179 RepID=A0A645C4V9_9ZZZZ